MADKVAVVTGSNKGIGYGIVKELCRRGVGIVYLTARDVTRGKEAIAKLKKEGLHAQFHQLDVSDKKSVKTLADHLKSKHGGLDILINNAGVIVSDLYKTTYDDAKRVIDINYKSVLIIQEYLFPVLKDNARVINISSDCGHISNLRNSYWIQRLTKQDIKLDDVNAFVDWFLESVKNGKLNKEDFSEMPMIAYRISKIALCALTRVQQKLVGKNISVNSLHPGFVQTDMTKSTGMFTLDEAGKAPCSLALDVDQSVKGKYFWYDKTEKDWTDTKQDLSCKFYMFEAALKNAGLM